MPLNLRPQKEGQRHWHGVAMAREGKFPQENPNHHTLAGANLLVAVAVAQAVSSSSLQELGFHIVSSG